MTTPHVGDRRPRDGRCERCDRPLCDLEWNASPPGWVFGPETESACRGSPWCTRSPIDWRERALAAETRCAEYEAAASVVLAQWTPDPHVPVFGNGSAADALRAALSGGTPSLNAVRAADAATIARLRAGLADTLVYATRYAMGRYTYAVADVIRAVKNHSTAADRRVLIEDLRAAFDAIARGESNRLGNDAADWRALLDWMVAQGDVDPTPTDDPIARLEADLNAARAEVVRLEYARDHLAEADACQKRHDTLDAVEKERDALAADLGTERSRLMNLVARVTGAAPALPTNESVSAAMRVAGENRKAVQRLAAIEAARRHDEERRGAK